MDKRKLGKSNLNAAILSMGAWAIGGGSWWGKTDDEASINALHKALDLGVNWIDTAPVYGFGHSEEVVGKFLKGRRTQVMISTKCGLQWYDKQGAKHFSRDGHDVYRDLSPKSIRRDLEYSLKRLDTDYIDIYYTHRQSAEDYFTPIEETMYELMKMKKEGKVRAIGASNTSLNHLNEYIKYGQLDVIQEKYSMLDRKIENELLPFCESNEITLQTYSPIEYGLLTDNIKADYVVKAGDARNNRKWWEPENRVLAVKMLSQWEDLAEKYNCSIGNLVIAWTVAQNDQINVLVGARKVEHVEENLKAANIVLEKVDIERMTRDANQTIALAK